MYVCMYVCMCVCVFVYICVCVGDHSRRAFVWGVLGACRLLWTASLRLIIIKMVATMAATADVLALSATEVVRIYIYIYYIFIVWVGVCVWCV